MRGTDLPSLAQRALSEYWRNRRVGLLLAGFDSTSRGLIDELTACGAGVDVVLSGGDPAPDAPRVEHLWIAAPAGRAGAPSSFHLWLRRPPTELRQWLDRIDPTRSLTFVGDPWTDVREVFGRRVHGRRRPGWGRFEDKTRIDAFWQRIDVAAPPYEVVACRHQAAEAAFAVLDESRGVVVSMDSTQGYRSGCAGLAWARNTGELRLAVDRFSGASKRVRIARFTPGVPCSIIALVTSDGVAVFEPIEMVILREQTMGQLVFCGSSNRWRPGSEVREAMRQVARRAGQGLAAAVNYRGIFSVDGILTPRGFTATEINPRHASGLGIRKGCPHFPIYLFQRAVQESLRGIGEISWRQIEDEFCEMIRSHPSHSVKVPAHQAGGLATGPQQLALATVNRPFCIEQTLSYSCAEHQARILGVDPMLDDGSLTPAAAALARRLADRDYRCFVDDDL